MVVLQRKTASFFECFPYVCPEPVLVKTSFIYINGSKGPFSYRVPPQVTLPNKVAGVVCTAAELLGEDCKVKRHVVRACWGLGIGDVIGKSSREEGSARRGALHGGSASEQSADKRSSATVRRKARPRRNSWLHVFDQHASTRWWRESLLHAGCWLLAASCNEMAHVAEDVVPIEPHSSVHHLLDVRRRSGGVAVHLRVPPSLLTAQDRTRWLSEAGLCAPSMAAAP